MLACTLVLPRAKKTSATQGSLRTSPGANESIYVVGWSVLFSFIFFFDMTRNEFLVRVSCAR